MSNFNFLCPLLFRFHQNGLNKTECLAGNKVFAIRFILFHKIQLKMLVPHICTCRSLRYNLCSGRCSLQRTHLFYFTHYASYSRTATFLHKPFNVLLRKIFIWVKPLFHNLARLLLARAKKGCHSF